MFPLNPMNRIPLFSEHLPAITYGDARVLFYGRRASDSIGMPATCGAAVYRLDGCWHRVLWTEHTKSK